MVPWKDYEQWLRANNPQITPGELARAQQAWFERFAREQRLTAEEERQAGEAFLGPQNWFALRANQLLQSPTTDPQTLQEAWNALAGRSTYYQSLPPEERVAIRSRAVPAMTPGIIPQPTVANPAEAIGTLAGQLYTSPLMEGVISNDPEWQARAGAGAAQLAENALTMPPALAMATAQTIGGYVPWLGPYAKAAAMVVAGRAMRRGAAARAASQAFQEQMPMDPNVARAMDPESTLRETLQGIAAAPASYAKELVATSMIPQAPAYAIGALIPPAAPAVMGGWSFIAEAGNKLFEEMEGLGINTRDPNNLFRVMTAPTPEEEKAIRDATAIAVAKGAPIAALDALSVRFANLGGKGSILGKALREQAIQGVLGGGGEALGEWASGEPFQPASITAEVGGEFVGGGQADIAIGAAAEAQRRARQMRMDPRMQALVMDEVARRSGAETAPPPAAAPQPAQPVTPDQGDLFQRAPSWMLAEQARDWATGRATAEEVVAAATNLPPGMTPEQAVAELRTLKPEAAAEPATPPPAASPAVAEPAAAPTPPPQPEHWTTPMGEERLRQWYRGEVSDEDLVEESLGKAPRQQTPDQAAARTQERLKRLEELKQARAELPQRTPPAIPEPPPLERPGTPRRGPLPTREEARARAQQQLPAQYAAAARRLEAAGDAHGARELREARPEIIPEEEYRPFLVFLRDWSAARKFHSVFARGMKRIIGMNLGERTAVINGETDAVAVVGTLGEEMAHGMSRADNETLAAWLREAAPEEWARAEREAVEGHRAQAGVELDEEGRLFETVGQMYQRYAPVVLRTIADRTSVERMKAAKPSEKRLFRKLNDVLAGITRKAGEAGIDVSWLLPELTSEQKGARSKVASIALRLHDALGAEQGATPAAPEPRLAVARQTETPEFRQWFGDSKVVDEQGLPRVVYHGATTSISRFIPGQGYHRLSAGMFTDSPEYASDYADMPGGNVIPAYLAMRNPLDVRGQGDLARRMPDQLWGEMTSREQAQVVRHDELGNGSAGDWQAGELLLHLARKYGYDGVIWSEGGGGTYVPFYSSQIKSATGNVGAFGQRPVTAAEAAGAGMTEEQAAAAQAAGDIRFAVTSISEWHPDAQYASKKHTVLRDPDHEARFPQEYYDAIEPDPGVRVRLVRDESGRTVRVVLTLAESPETYLKVIPALDGVGFIVDDVASPVPGGARRLYRQAALRFRGPRRGTSFRLTESGYWLCAGLPEDLADSEARVYDMKRSADYYGQDAILAKRSPNRGVDLVVERLPGLAPAGRSFPPSQWRVGGAVGRQGGAGEGAGVHQGTAGAPRRATGVDSEGVLDLGDIDDVDFNDPDPDPKLAVERLATERAAAVDRAIGAGTPVDDIPELRPTVLEPARWLDRVRRTWQDKFIRLRRVDEAIKATTGVGIPDDMSAYVLENLYHSAGGERLLNQLYRPFVIPLSRLMQRLGVTFDQENKFRLARHAPEGNDFLFWEGVAWARERLHRELELHRKAGVANNPTVRELERQLSMLTYAGHVSDPVEKMAELQRRGHAVAAQALATIPGAKDASTAELRRAYWAMPAQERIDLLESWLDNPVFRDMMREARMIPSVGITDAQAERDMQELIAAGLVQRQGTEESMLVPSPEMRRVLATLPPDADEVDIREALAGHRARWRAGRQRATYSGKLAQVAGIIDRMLERRLQIAVESGLVPQEAADRARATYTYYTPVRGSEELGDLDSLDPFRGAGSAGRGFDVRGPDLRRRVGLLGRPSNPTTQQAILDVQNTIIRAERVKGVGRAILHLARTYKGLKVRNMHTGQLDPLFEVMPMRGKFVLTAQGDIVEVRELERGQFIFATKEGGRQFFIRINDAGLATLLTGLSESGHESRVPDVVQNILKYQRAINNVLRDLITSWNPAFPLPNFANDLQTALVSMAADYGETAAYQFSRLVPSSAMAIREAEAAMFDLGRGEDEAAEEARVAAVAERGEGLSETARLWLKFKRGGGVTGITTTTDMEDLIKSLNAMVRMQGRSTGAVLQRNFFLIRDAVSAANMVAENATRFAAYRWALDHRQTEAQALSLAKNLTVNFNRRGEAGGFLNTMYLFSNAGIQGSAKILGLTRKHPGFMASLFGTQVAAGFAAAMVARALLGEDEDEKKDRWDKIPQSIKRRYWIFPANWVGVPGVDYLTIRVPPGLNMGMVLGYELDRVRAESKKRGKVDAEWLQEQSYHLSVEMWSALWEGFFPLGGQPMSSVPDVAMAIAPSGVGKLATEIGINRTQLGGRIKPEGPGVRNLPASEVHFDNVSTSAEWIADFINRATGGGPATEGVVSFSPEWIDHTLENYFGGVGQLFSQGKKLTERLMSDEDIPASPREWPIVSRFLRQVEDRNVSADYSEAQKFIDGLEGNIQGYTEEGRTEKARRLRERHARLLSGMGRLKALERAIRKAKTIEEKTAAQKRWLAAYRELRGELTRREAVESGGR